MCEVNEIDNIQESFDYGSDDKQYSFWTRVMIDMTNFLVFDIIRNQDAKLRFYYNRKGLVTIKSGDSKNLKIIKYKDNSKFMIRSFLCAK